MSKASALAKLAEGVTLVEGISEGNAPSMPTPHNCLAGTVPSATSWTPWEAWTDAVSSRHARMQGDVESGRIAFIGTSVTASMNVARVHPAGINWGIAGDKMAGVLNRMSTLTHLSTAGAVVLEIGINDAGYTVWSDMDAQLSKIFGWLTGPLVVLSLIPQGNGFLSLGNLAAVNSMMASKLAGRTNCAFVDVTTPLQDTDGFMKSNLSIGDRMHPNAAGYAVLRPIIQAGLASVGIS